MPVQPSHHENKVRDLVLVLGDQLDRRSSAFDTFDGGRDAVLMMEVNEEATYVPQHKLRLVYFFSAMRHFCELLRQKGSRVLYTEISDPDNRGSLRAEVAYRASMIRPERLVLSHPGDWRVLQSIKEGARLAGIALEVRTDAKFICSTQEFADFADSQQRLVLENFYRHMRRKHEVLIDNGEPVGGQWNFDKHNRESFGRNRPDHIKRPRSFRPDALTEQVIEVVDRRFPDSPGRLSEFDYPVNPRQAGEALRDFIDHRLPLFGRYQDAMHSASPYLYHSRLSCVLNLHLLDPRQAIDAAVGAYEAGTAPINSVEGFARQILGWREFVRGIYWRHMPEYGQSNALDANLSMPRFMWTAETDMNCVRIVVQQLIDHAYAHHIQRLMVLGLFALLLGVRPQQVHDWHMSMYIDAVDWVSLPNVVGMSQFGDGGLLATKPYCASGNYISRMSDYCKGCRYDPKKATGDDACPFTTLYWDFLARHRRSFAKNTRLFPQLKNLDRKQARDVRAIRRRADQLKTALTAETYL